MTTQSEEITILKANQSALQSLFLGNRDGGKWHVLAGNLVSYGCNIRSSPLVTGDWSAGTYTLDQIVYYVPNTTHYRCVVSSTTDTPDASIDWEEYTDSPYLLSLYAPDPDGGNVVNPDTVTPPVRIEQYGNGAIIYGDVFNSEDINDTTLDLASFSIATPSATADYVRHDLVYLAVGPSGPLVKVAKGIAWDNSGGGAYDITGSDKDPTVPKGGMAIARVRSTETAINSTDLTFYDLRVFTGNLNGSDGVDGINSGSTFGYEYSTTTSGDPGSGGIRANNVDLTSVTEIYIDDEEENAVDLSTFFTNVGAGTSTIKGYIVLSSQSVASNYVIYSVETITDNTGYFDFVSTYIGGTVSSFTDTEDINISLTSNGDKGDQGIQGLTGLPGGSTFGYEYSTTTTDSDPTSGVLRLDNVDLTLATGIYIDDEEENAVDLSSFFNNIATVDSTIKSYITIYEQGTPSNYVVYSLGAITDNTGYFDLTITYVTGSVSSFSDTEDIYISFSRTGDKGDQGDQGTQGDAWDQWQGAWSAGSYNYLDAVEHNDSSWVCSNVSGTSGEPGVSGDWDLVALKGTDGTNGSDGADGANTSSSFVYAFSNSTGSSDPTSGIFNVNNADLTLATFLYIDDEEENAVDLSSFFNSVDAVGSTIKAHITLSSKNDPTNYVIYEVTDITDNTGYFTFTISYSVGSVSSFVNTEDIIIGFARTGDKGIDGAGAGDVVGPASAVDNHIATFDLATGKLIQDGGNTIAEIANVTHTGEVTGSTALTIADNIVDEANLKLDEAPTNDYILTADSTKSGGMKWAEAGSGTTSPLTTKGDLYGYSTDNARLPVGTNDQVLVADSTESLGIKWKALDNVTANRYEYTATADQTTFSATYDVGYVDVYLNGIKLKSTTDFTATSGTSIVLATGATLNDIVAIVGYGVSNASRGTTLEITAGESLVNGDWCYLKSDGKMWKTDASAEATAAGMILVCTGTTAADATGTFVKRDAYTTSGLTTGATYFLSETSATITTTKPTTAAAIVRVVGYALSTTVLIVDVDQTYIEV